MKIYKYRTLHKIDHITDTLVNGYVYCSYYEALNDPFEGQFMKLYNPNQFGTIQFGTTHQFSSNTAIIESLNDKYRLNKRICSFSKTGKDIKMWAYYADSHKGICIEFEIDDSDPNFVNVEYREHLKEVHSYEITDQIALNILKHKTKQWCFEKEIRLISDKEKYNLRDKIRSVIIGIRTSAKDEGVIKSICGDIPIKYAKLNDDLKITIERWNK